MQLLICKGLNNPITGFAKKATLATGEAAFEPVVSCHELTFELSGRALPLPLRLSEGLGSSARTLVGLP